MMAPLLAHRCPRCIAHSVKADVLTAITCPRCGAEATASYGLPSGNLEAFCTACVEPPYQWYGFIVKARGGAM